MLRLVKTIFLILLAILAFGSLFLILEAAKFSSWMYNYQAYSAKTAIADITVSPVMQDDKGQYMNITYQPISIQSALLTNIGSDINPQPVTESQTIKVYGDTVHIGGPIIKIQDSFSLIKTKTIYKVAMIYGKYNLTTETTDTTPSSFDLNGGIDTTYQYLQEHLSEWPYNQVIQSMQIDTPGVFGSLSFKEKQYKLYITETGFSWEMVQ